MTAEPPFKSPSQPQSDHAHHEPHGHSAHLGDPHDTHRHAHHLDEPSHESHRHDAADHTGHTHGQHDHSHIPTNQRILWISFLIITIFMVVEAVGGYLFGSLALLADAGHMLNDSLSLGLAGFAIWYGQRHGGKTLELSLALLNGLSLLLIAGFIVKEAMVRFSHPQPIATNMVILIAALGLVVNLVVLKIMQHGEHDNLNMKAAYAHVIADVLGSVAAIVASLAILLFHWQWADPLASLIVALVVFKSGISVSWQAYQALRHLA